ncbi:hypothetical protein C0989_001645 [Termitomyces sp. Mn162]|nr:hypothetical protein C0989_001645 [Termitomyces sp. Mn162]
MGMQPGEKFDDVQVSCMAYQPASNIPKVTPLTNNTLATLSPSNSVPAPATKPADKGKASNQPVTNEQLPITKEPVTQPPVHPFSGIPSCYAPPANRNFTALNRSNNSTYQTMLPINNIEQSKAVFERVLSIKFTVSVGKLCSVSQDIKYQFRTAVTPKQLVGASTNTVQDPSNIFKDALLTFTIEEPQFLLGSNAATTDGFTPDQASVALVDPIEAYIDLLPLGKEPMVLTVAKDSQRNRVHHQQWLPDYFDTLPIDLSNTDITPTYINIPFPAQFVANNSVKQKGVQVKKKYKPVTMKTKPVAGHISKDF